MDSTAAVGTSMLFARQDHVHPSDTSRAADASVVKITAQSLTAPQQQQARQNIYAAPFDAMAYSGLQSNGGMEVSQENGSAGLAVSGVAKYIIDGWAVQSIGTQVLSSQQNTTLSLAGTGFIAALSTSVTTANASPAAGHYCSFIQKIEGWRVARLAWGTSNAQPVTLGFWVYAVRTGNYSGSISNGAFNRSYPFSFTVNAAATWEYKTVTIPGDTTGTWAKDNTIGLQINIAMMAGSTYQAANGAWTAGGFLGVTGTINGVAATSDVMAITGVTMHSGNEGPSAARSPFIVRPYPQELETCKRYWQLVMPETRAGAFSGSAFFGATYPFVEMRVQPTITIVAVGISANASAYTFVALSNKEGRTSLTSAAAGDCYVLSRTYSLDARL
jgi:hypothetical protein